MDTALASDVSICIITYERQSILTWHLQVLNRLGFRGQVVIAEGGSEPFDTPTLRKLGFEVVTIHLPRHVYETAPENAARCMNAALRRVSRPFFTMTCDDDLRVPKALHNMQSVLSGDTSVSAVSTTRIYLALASMQLSDGRSKFWVSLPRTHRGSLPYAKVSEPKSLDSPDLVCRLRQFEKNRFHGMFTVMRSEDRPPEVSAYTFQNPHFGSDYQWLLNPVFRGKTVPLKTVGTISLIHGKNLSAAADNPFRSDPAKLDELHTFARLWDTCNAENIDLVCHILNRYDSTSRPPKLVKEMVRSARYFQVSRKWCTVLNGQGSQ